MRLRGGLHYQLFEGIAVFLDVTNGRYFFLRGDLARRFAAYAAEDASEQDIQVLTEHGIIVDANPSMGCDSIVPSVAMSYLDRGHGRATPWLTLRAAIAQRTHHRRVTRHSFANVIACLRRSKSEERSAPLRRRGSSEADISAAFVRAQRLVPSIDQCLPRSVALAAMLRSHGHVPTIVFGVQFPFAAHCWVQCDERLVSDVLDKIRPFKPILAI